MSRSVDEQLRELETEVRNLDVLPAAAVRARGGRRRRRQVTAMAAAGAVVAVTAGLTATWPEQRTEQGLGQPAVPATSCVLALPDSPAEVRIRVLDGGAAAGVPDATAAQLRARDFTVLDETTGDRSGDAAALLYGPAAIGAASLLRAAVHGEVAMRFDPDRRDDTIDLTLGPAFTRLATTTELNRNLVAAGEPSAPPQCN